jgi:hypothetical protein
LVVAEVHLRLVQLLNAFLQTRLLLCTPLLSDIAFTLDKGKHHTPGFASMLIDTGKKQYGGRTSVGSCY